MYQKWAEDNNFLSMLPKDAENRRNNAQADKQSHLDSHLREKPRKETVTPYTDKRFRDAAIEWLVSTDQVCDNFSNAFYGLIHKLQPIQALNHEMYHNMIRIAASATNGVKIPDRRQTRQVITNMFKLQLQVLHDKLNVWEILHCDWLLMFYLEWIGEGKSKLNMWCVAGLQVMDTWQWQDLG